MLHVDYKGNIELVVPYRASVRSAEKFLKEKSDWIYGQVRGREELIKKNKLMLFDGELIPLFSDKRKLIIKIDKNRKKNRFVDGSDFLKIFIAEKDEVADVVERWYKREARDYFEVKVKQLARMMSVNAGALAISSATTQWGSCNAGTRRISLHWRLMMAPQGVADYVVAHEVAHLKVAGHNKKFWNQVRKLDPKVDEHRRWLRKNGAGLWLK